MTIEQIRQHVIELAVTNVIPQANALAALEYLNERNVNRAIAEIINFI